MNLRRLVFTKEGDLDLSWVLGIVLVSAGLWGFALEAQRPEGASDSAWIFLGSTVALVFGGGTIVSRGRLLSKARVAVADAAAGAAADVAAVAVGHPATTIPETLTDIRRDDETDPEWPS